MPIPPKNELALKARAVAYLSRREHSRAELARKLRSGARRAIQAAEAAEAGPAQGGEGRDESGGFDEAAAIGAVLDELEREGWLSNERYALSLVHRRAARQGAARIVQEMRRQGLPEAVVNTAREQLCATEYERALAVWVKRYGGAGAGPAAPAAGSAEYARQARFLAGRGFSHETIRRVLRVR